MANFLSKILGGGSQSAPPPKPPVVIQYPNVLTPPQDGGLETIESYQYSEVVELLSDGPIEGLVNKNGIKVDGVNLFEGVYLNDSPIKETSDINYDCFQSVSRYISSKIDEAWGKELGADLLYGEPPLTMGFAMGPMRIKTYVDSASLEFLDSQKKTEWLSSEISCYYKLFLTEICTNYITVNLNNKTIDGSIPNSISLDMYDISQEMYPKICSDLFNLYSYFEMPKSVIAYGSISRQNVVFTSNTLIDVIKIIGSKDSNNFIVFQIWSVAKDINGKLMPIYDPEILKKYFNVYAYQTKKSLFNFNSIQVEFKNGSQYQPPLDSIKNVEIDYKINKELIGPFKRAGQVRRLKSFLADSSRPPYTNVTLEQEGSTDVRYIRSWPVEYDINSNPYLICDLCMSYSDYNQTTRNVKDQDAYPYTHYVLNQNAECVYISMNLSQLYDTTHVDLASDETNLGLKTTKFQNTELVPAGTETYFKLDFFSATPSKATYWKKNVNPGTQGSRGAIGDNLEPEPCDFSSACQHITVGTRLPSVVSFKVETGYETDADGNKENSLNNYFSYRYDIFGMTQDPNVSLDFGRSNLEYLKYVYSYKSSRTLIPSLIHLNPYEAYDPTSGKKIIYTETKYSEWLDFFFLQKLSGDDFNYFNVLIAYREQIPQRADLIERFSKLEAITIYSYLRESLDISKKVFLNTELTIGLGDGVMGNVIVDTIYLYEIVDSKITRIDSIPFDYFYTAPTDELPPAYDIIKLQALKASWSEYYKDFLPAFSFYAKTDGFGAATRVWNSKYSVGGVGGVYEQNVRLAGLASPYISATLNDSEMEAVFDTPQLKENTRLYQDSKALVELPVGTKFYYKTIFVVTGPTVNRRLSFPEVVILQNERKAGNYMQTKIVARYEDLFLITYTSKGVSYTSEGRKSEFIGFIDTGVIT